MFFLMHRKRLTMRPFLSSLLIVIPRLAGYLLHYAWELPRRSPNPAIQLTADRRVTTLNFMREFLDVTNLALSQR